MQKMTTNNQHIVIIGGGPAGLEAAACLGTSGYRVTVIEKEKQTGGKLQILNNLFPEFRNSDEVLNHLSNRLKTNPPKILTNSEVVSLIPENGRQLVNLSDGQAIKADSVLITAGFKLYNAEKKEEYGYQIYDNVITSFDLEKQFKGGNPVRTTMGLTPRRIAFIHCVGSRDKKSGNVYCSRTCCITGVKQAIEIKQRLPDAEIFNFYMDLRMFGQNFEELYIEAQQKWGVTFIRGRVSEIAEHLDNSLQIKAEDTLSGRPIRMSFDLIVLLAGMVPEPRTLEIGKSAGLAFTSGNFLAGMDSHMCQNETNTPGIFIAGTCREPLSVSETLTDARAATVKMISWLRENEAKSNN